MYIIRRWAEHRVASARLAATFWGTDSLDVREGTAIEFRTFGFTSAVSTGAPRDSISVAVHRTRAPRHRRGARFEMDRHSIRRRLTTACGCRSTSQGREHGRASDSDRAEHDRRRHDALWMRLSLRRESSQQPPRRPGLPFDATNGRIANTIDTLYRLGARDNSFSVTADGEERSCSAKASRSSMCSQVDLP